DRPTPRDPRPPHLLPHWRRRRALRGRRVARRGARRDGGRRRRVGVRQVGDGALGAAPHPAAGPHRAREPHRVRGARPAGRLGAGDALHPRPADRDDLPGADDRAQPGVHGGRPGGGGGARARPGLATRGVGARGGHARAGGHLVARRARGAVPAPALGRDAAAGDDRDGARAQPRPRDRRRADHGARRHDPGADPRAARRAAVAARHVDPDDHARPRRGGRDGPAGRGDVRRGGRRAVVRGRPVRAAAPPVHGGAAPLDAPRGAAAGAPHDDPRHRAAAHRVARRVPVPRALSLRLGAVRRGAPAALPDRRGARVALPSGGGARAAGAAARAVDGAAGRGV
ncbi:MAG: Oligopeptide transport ATP-binding protein OppD, partial [uncultured Solirubrobacteraceae bacterium]